MDNTDIIVLTLLFLGLALYYNRETIRYIFSSDDDDVTAVNSSGSRDIVQVLLENNKNYLVLYASQTGTAEDYAKSFSKELSSKFSSLNVMCADIESYDFDTLNSLPKDIIVSFFISTYGEGDFPDGSFSFEQFIITASDDALSLNNVDFTIFGLGNSTYEFYNGAAKKCRKYLVGAGATQLGPLGEGDDGRGTTDEDYLAWKEEMLEILKSKLQLSERDQIFSPSYDYIELSEINDSVALGEPSKEYLPNEKLNVNAQGVQVGPFDHSHPYVAPVTSSRELISNSCLLYTSFLYSSVPKIGMYLLK